MKESQQKKISEYEKILADVDSFKRRISEIQGVLKEKKKILKKSYGCDSLKQATKLLKKFEKQVEKTRGEFEKAMLTFAEKWQNGFDRLQDEG